ncbi:riboflavin biosynthesis protein RibF, partial [bacterium]|nr:riboflavin biosynthesis protein RibF [bacterium]
MEVIYGLGKTGRKFENSLITIGTFDGVHIGHQRIINEVIKRSNQTGGTSTVLTFNLHPLKVITPGTTPPLLSSVNHKIRVLNKLGLARCILIDFNRDFFTLEPADFVKQILVDTLGVSELFLGNNYRFGK